MPTWYDKATTDALLAQKASAAALPSLAPLVSPAFTGTPTIGGTAVAKTSDVAAAISNLVNGAGPAVDTLGELAALLASDESAAAALATLVASKVNAAQVDTKIAAQASTTAANFVTYDGATLKQGGTVVPISGGSGTAPGYDVILLAGQSNMVGGGADATNSVIDITDPDIWVYATGGTNAGVAVQATDPLIHHSGTAQNVGPGMEFARWYRTIYPTRRVLLVPAAHSGTAILSGSPRWDATTAWPNDANNLYNAAIAQAQAALVAAGANSKLAAVLWIQGESDAIAGTSGAAYRPAFEYIIDGFRARLSAPTLPFIIGSMVPEFIPTYTTAAAIDAVHSATPTRKAYTAYVTGPSGAQTGNLHYLAGGARTLGRGMAAAYLTALTNTAPSAAVAANPPTAPTPTLTNSVAPVISGTASVGSVLTATNGSWSATPDSYTYVWRRAGAPITGATASSYTLVSADTGQAVTLTVTAIKAGYTSGTATSNSITVGGGTGGTVAADSFTRGDSTTLGSTETGGLAWTTSGAGWAISSNALAFTGTADQVALVNTGTADNWTIQFTATAVSGAYPLSFAWGSGTAANQVSKVFRSNGDSTWAIYNAASGNLVSRSAPSAPSNGDVFKLSKAGQTITLFQNGAQVAQWTGWSANTSAGDTWQGIGGAGNIALTVDLFTVTAP